MNILTFDDFIFEAAKALTREELVAELNKKYPKPKTFNPIQQEKILKNYKNKKSYFRQKDGSQVLKVIRYRDWETDRKSTRLNSSHSAKSRMPSSA